jgi:redox-sensitive bicupin YhaK (pirin superfamily)
MTRNLAVVQSVPARAERKVIERTRGSGRGLIVRLMSPSDLGQHLKPFVFLDQVDADSSVARGMNLHPHSGVATVTVLTEGNLRFDKGKWGVGVLDYGGVEWMRAGSGIWHGDEYQPGSTPRFKGFQLWVALPAALEASSPEWHGIYAAGDMIVFDKSDAAIALRAGADGAAFVLGSAVPHPHDLVLGYNPCTRPRRL